MNLLYTEFLLAIFAITSLYKTRNLFHPSCVITLLWLIVYGIYNNCNHDLFNLSDKFNYLIILWTLFFSFFCYYSNKVKIYLPHFCCIKTDGFYFKHKTYWLVIISNFLLIISLIKMGNGVFSFETLREELVENSLPLHIKILYYVNQFSIVYALALLYFHTSKERKYLYLLTLILMIALLFKSNKTGFIIYFVGSIYILYKRKSLNYKTIIITLFSIIFFLFIITILRGDTDDKSFDWEDHLIIYLLSPLPAMDLILNNELTINSGAWGSSTFAFFYNVLDFLNISYDRNFAGGWVSVPLPTNVYTCLRSFYVDFGNIGIPIFASILGYIWGRLYKFQKEGYTIFIIFFSSMFYSLFVQFFSDYFFGFFSVTLQNLFFSLFICYHFSFKRIKVRIYKRNS